MASAAVVTSRPSTPSHGFFHEFGNYSPYLSPSTFIPASILDLSHRLSLQTLSHRNQTASPTPPPASASSFPSFSSSKIGVANNVPSTSATYTSLSPTAIRRQRRQAMQEQCSGGHSAAIEALLEKLNEKKRIERQRRRRSASVGCAVGKKKPVEMDRKMVVCLAQEEEMMHIDTSHLDDTEAEGECRNTIEESLTSFPPFSESDENENSNDYNDEANNGPMNRAGIDISESRDGSVVVSGWRRSSAGVLKSSHTSEPRGGSIRDGRIAKSAANTVVRFGGRRRALTNEFER